MSSKQHLPPQRSQGGLAALDVFYRGLNDINFYVEDEEQENLYFAILNKVFPGVRIDRIFPLGGKLNVLKHARDPDSCAIGKKVYILDKDFDDLLGKVEVLDGVFYLDRFCIENYFLDENALVEVVIESNPKLKREKVCESLALGALIPRIGETLRTLFGLFFIVQSAGLAIPNCGEKPERFCKEKLLWEPCPNLVHVYADMVSKRLADMGFDELESSLLNDARLAPYHAKESHLVVSGKFWLAMVFHFIKSKYNLDSISFSSFVFRVAKNCDLAELKKLSSKVNASLS